MFSNRKVTIATISVLVIIFAFGAWSVFAQDDTVPPCDFGQIHGMMGNTGMQGRGGMGHGMMNDDFPEDCLHSGYYSMGMMGGMMGQYGGGMSMMMGFDSEMIGQFEPGSGMMGAWTPPSELAPAGETLTLDEAVLIAEAYIAEWDADVALELGEVMQFDNHFYATAFETESGKGAFEFLINPTDGIVFGEPGPNMMWNLQYGMSMGRGAGIYSPTNADIEMTVSIEQAQVYAQSVLDETIADATVESEADIFYGYYTFHIQQNGEIIGMLSVNGFTGQVWLHHWHGSFIAITGHAE